MDDSCCITMTAMIWPSRPMPMVLATPMEVRTAASGRPEWGWRRRSWPGPPVPTGAAPAGGPLSSIAAASAVTTAQPGPFVCGCASHHPRRGRSHDRPRPAASRVRPPAVDRPGDCPLACLNSKSRFRDWRPGPATAIGGPVGRMQGCRPIPPRAPPRRRPISAPTVPAARGRTPTPGSGHRSDCSTTRRPTRDGAAGSPRSGRACPTRPGMHPTTPSMCPPRPAGPRSGPGTWRPTGTALPPTAGRHLDGDAGRGRCDAVVVRRPGRGRVRLLARPAVRCRARRPAGRCAPVRPAGRAARISAGIEVGRRAVLAGFADDDGSRIHLSVDRRDRHGDLPAYRGRLGGGADRRRDRVGARPYRARRRPGIRPCAPWRSTTAACSPNCRTHPAGAVTRCRQPGSRRPAVSWSVTNAAAGTNCWSGPGVRGGDGTAARPAR